MGSSCRSHHIDRPERDAEQRPRGGKKEEHTHHTHRERERAGEGDSGECRHGRRLVPPYCTYLLSQCGCLQNRMREEGYVPQWRVRVVGDLSPSPQSSPLQAERASRAAEQRADREEQSTTSPGLAALASATCTGLTPAALWDEDTVAPPVQDEPCTGGKAQLRTVHCVADGPAIRHSKVQVQVPNLLSLSQCTLPSLSCVGACAHWYRYLIAHRPLHACDCNLYLSQVLRYPAPTLVCPRPWATLPCFSSYCPCPRARAEQNTQVAHTHTTPTQILSLLLLQHSRTLRVSALLPFATAPDGQSVKEKQQSLDPDTIYRRD